MRTTPTARERSLRNELVERLERVEDLTALAAKDYGRTVHDAYDDDTTVLGALIAAIHGLVELNLSLRRLVDAGDASAEAALICGAADATIAVLLQLTGELAAADDYYDDAA